ncbi:MAG: tRNA (adenosine(37)-N6)-threonylcarbamoyltransferase complex ATPase subunit type 1 TsaE [Candidatus Anstonellales archaeon]
MKEIYISENKKETERLGKKIVKKIIKKKLKNTALILALEGGLGSGKTTFSQALGKALGITEKIVSPTFVIIREYKLQSPNFKKFYHIDCYRLKKIEEIKNLNFMKIIKDNNIKIEAHFSSKNMQKKFVVVFKQVTNFLRIDNQKISISIE